MIINRGLCTDDATATEGQILTGYSAYSKGEKIIGTVANQGEKIITPTKETQTFSGGMYSKIVVNGDDDFLASNIRQNINLFGLTGSLIEGKPYAEGDIFNFTGNKIEIHTLKFKPKMIGVLSLNNKYAQQCACGFVIPSFGTSNFKQYANGYIHYSGDSAFNMSPTFFDDGFSCFWSVSADWIKWVAIG